MSMDTHEIAWAAGFFDGEGTTRFALTREKYATIFISVPNTRLENLVRFKEAVGDVGAIYKKNRDKEYVKEHYKDCWYFQASAFRDVQVIIARMWKYLSPEKRSQAHLAFSQEREINKHVPRKKRAVCGTASKYQSGCRCDDCRIAKVAYNREYYQRNGERLKLVSRIESKKRYDKQKLGRLLENLETGGMEIPDSWKQRLS